MGQLHDKPSDSSTASVWILSELYAPELTSTGYYLTKIAERAAARLGTPVRVVCSQPTYSARGLNAPRREQLGGVDVVRTWSPSLPKDSLPGKLGNMIAFSVGVSAILCRSVRPGDVVLAVTNPPLLPYLASLVARWRGARFVLLVHDMFPETLVVAGLAGSSSLAVRVLDAASRALVRSAHTVVAIGRDMEVRLVAKGARKTCVIPNWADVQEITAVPTPPSCAANTPFIVQYAGNIGRTHDVELLLDVAEQLGPAVRWDFIGTGARRQFVESAAAARGLSNVRIADYRPRPERSASLGACHVAVISFVAGMSGISVPSRMYNVMAAARPIIAVCDDDAEIARVIRERRIGWVVPPGDTAALAAAVTAAASSPDECAAMGARARAAAEGEYSSDQVLERYASALASVVELRV
ncbi:MAG: glycosyltransferase family 4 protein [Gemmatimonadaceae bacterium]